ncbi:MAG: L,D-transpeptidase [Clostridiales bacterium]|nr:L,D-transpeptidase [Clostridiales bacterium]
MNRRTVILFLVAALLLPLLGLGEEHGAHLVATSFPGFIRPGKTEIYQYNADHDGTASLHLLDEAGEQLFAIQEGHTAREGANSIIWNGYDNAMKPLTAGYYRLRLQMGEHSLEQPLQVGLPSPQITQLVLPNAQVNPGEEWRLGVQVNMPGALAVVFHVAEQYHELFNQQVPEGLTDITWDGLTEGKAPPEGFHTLTVVFIDESGFAANQHHITLEVLPAAMPVEPTLGITDEGVFQQEEQGDEPLGDDPALDQAEEPSDKRVNVVASGKEDYHYAVPTMEEVPEEDIGKDFWRLPVGDYNEEAIWKVMMQPITVIWGRDQRETYKLRATRDDSTKRDNIVGELGYESQGVHVIEQYDDGWTLVEAYNSSYGPDNRTRRGYGDTDALIRGYVRTNLLRVIQPRDDYGIMIDKLRQRMYIFKDGKIFTELLISTGIPTKKQPWNETPSGEFLMVSRTGDFNAGNLVCRMSMRINGGNLIHEVPYILNERTGHWDYSSQEAQLGKKASHGCIRVQRVNNADGINMTWLWSNIKLNTKVLVWDDDGRYYDYPEDSLALFYNPNGGKFYHLDQNCRSIRDRFLPLQGSLVYAQLDDHQHSKLTACATCNPPLRPSQIDQINKDNGF